MLQADASRNAERCWTDRAPSGAAPVRIIAAIALAEECAPGLTLTQLRIFMAVAAEEGIRLNDLGARTGESQAVISRNVRALTSAAQPGSLKPAYGLLTLLRDREDGRGRRAALSAAGRNLLTRIELALQS